MKKTILGTVVCLGGLVGLATKPAAAEMVDLVKVNLPHAASVGGVTLPAGEYTIKDVQDAGGSAVLEISSFDGKSVAAIAMPVVSPTHQSNKETRVVLKSDGESYRIQSIWIEGDDMGYQFLSGE